jgi:hypothetical protein
MDSEKQSNSMTMTLIDLHWHGRELPPHILRERGLRAAAVCEGGLAIGRSDAEKLGRTALRALVDAFLGDRVSNADLFTRAHRLGRRLSEAVHCQWTSGDEIYTLDCPIYGLHRPFAHSLAMTVTTECSICGAGALQCAHVPGEEYEGESCFSKVTGIGALGHVALTADPDFIYTWHQRQSVATSAIIADGTIKRAGDVAFCTHCQDCDGLPREGDLDPVGRLERLIASAQSN